MCEVSTACIPLCNGQPPLCELLYIMRYHILTTDGHANRFLSDLLQRAIRRLSASM